MEPLTDTSSPSPTGEAGIVSPAPSATGSAQQSARFASVAPYRDIKVAAVAALSYLTLFWIARLLPYGQITVLATTLTSLPLVLLFVVALARTLRSLRALVANTLISGALFLPSVVILILHARFPYWPVWRPIGPTFHLYRTFLSHISDHGLILIWFAACVGVWISRLIREMKILLPIAVVLACVDLYVVFGGGLVTQAVRGNSHVAQTAMKALTVDLPTVHTSTGAAPMQLSVGFADYLFIALFFACFARFGTPSRRTFQALCVVLTAYLLIVYLTGLALPALVPIAVVVIGMNLRAFRYERSEAFALLYAGLIVAALLGGLFFMSHRA